MEHNLEITVTAHGKTRSIYASMGTRHNGRNTKHEQCLYDPTYSNIISGLTMPDEFIMKGKKEKVQVKAGRAVLYKINRDANGMWIKPANSVGDREPAGIKKTEVKLSKRKEAAKEMHKRYGHISYKTLP